MRYSIQELGLGGILDQAITLIKNHFGLLIGITCVLQIPIGMVNGFAGLNWIQISADGELVTNPAAATIYFASTFVLLIVVLPFTNAAVTYAIASKYLDQPVSVWSAVGRAVRSIFPLIWTWILFGAALFGGVILLVVPAILCLFWFALATQVVILEGKNGFAALKRSKQLMKGGMAMVFVLWLLLGSINVGITFGAAFVPQQHLAVIGSVFAQAVSTILASAAFVVFYFSSRCRHENFDLTLLAESIGQQPAEAVDEETVFDAEG